MLKSKLSLALLAATMSFQAFAADNLTTEMQGKFPNTPITSATELSDFPGVVEMVVGGKQIFYTNKDGSRLLIGHIFNPTTNTDLTQAHLDELNIVDWASLPMKDSITIKKGKGEREIAVFTDPDCPYCKKLEQEMEHIDNVTIHLFMYPLTSLHPNSKNIAQSVACSKDKPKAWSDYVLNGTAPQAKSDCEAAKMVDRNIEFGTKMGLSGTPAIIAKNGHVKPGYMPAAQLDQWLDANAKALPKAAKSK
ncbi:MAG: DsbC family protein [Proteobacteria bacterium]|nr:DsbC family protein [Pseudomonadota bacterium]